MNKDKLIQRLQGVSPKLQSELDYYLNDVDHEEIPDYNIADAFEDYVNIILQDKLTAEIKRIYIEVGYVQSIDITKVFVNHGSKYWFKANDLHYQCVSGWDEWINN